MMWRGVFLGRGFPPSGFSLLVNTPRYSPPVISMRNKLIREEDKRKLSVLFDYKVLGAVFLGRFVGDLAVLLVYPALGKVYGAVLGLFLTVVFVLFWEEVEWLGQSVEDAANGD